MATKNTLNLQATKLVASLEAKIKKLQSQISQARTKAVADAKKNLAVTSKAVQKGKKDAIKLSAKLKAATVSAKKAKTTAARVSAKKRVNAAKSALTKQKALIVKLLNALSSTKNDLAVAKKTKQVADTLEKAALKISSDFEKSSTKKVIKKMKSAPKTKATIKRKVKKTSTKKVTPKTIKNVEKKTKEAVEQTRQNTLFEVTTAPVIEPTPKVETQAENNTAAAPSPKIDQAPTLAPPNPSSVEEINTQKTSPFLNAGDSLFD